MDAALASLLAKAAFMHDADPSGIYRPHSVGMMHECIPGELLASATFMHQDDKGYNTLNLPVALKGSGRGGR